MTTTLIPAAVILAMRSWLADLTFVDLASDDVMDASVVSDVDVIDAVDRLYAGGTSAFVLTEDLAVAAAAGVSDAQLLEQVALMLARPRDLLAEPRRPGVPLSALIAHVCHAHVPAPMANERAKRLTLLLADYLHCRHVLRESQVSPAGLDAWAKSSPLVIVPVRACARSLGGDLR